MSVYMVQARITGEALQAMATSDTDRRAVVGKMLEGIGGKLIGYYFAFGASDVVVIGEAPDNVSMASVAIAVASSGSLSDVVTTPLLSYEEGIEAVRGAGGVSYVPPGD